MWVKRKEESYIIETGSIVEKSASSIAGRLGSGLVCFCTQPHDHVPGKLHITEYEYKYEELQHQIQFNNINNIILNLIINTNILVPFLPLFFITSPEYKN